MQIPISWINEIVKINTTQLDLLIEKLTLGGFEVEEVIELKTSLQEKTGLEISATANRSDSLSIQGLSQEISALLNQPIEISKYSNKPTNWKKYVKEQTKFTLKPDDNCSIFLAIIVENFSNTAVPKWVTQKLLDSGFTPSNSLIDFQDYVLLETGYPICIYDFEKICTRLETSDINFSISSEKQEQLFLAKNDVTYKLNESMLTVKANEIPVSIAGLIEANEFAYSKSTNVLLIEGSIFNAAKIRQQSRGLGLRTERSARYEKSLKNTYLIEAVYRLISLLRINNPNLVCKLHTIDQTEEKNKEPIILKYENINEILGPISVLNEQSLIFISPKLISDYLTRLNFVFESDEANLEWKVTIPHSRTDDLTREIDLIEEIGRLHGFNHFLTILPALKTVGTEDFNYQTRKKITNCLLNLGLNELIHYSLVGKETWLKNEIQLVNPLSADCSNLRASLLPNLIKTLQENLKQKNVNLEGFEYGHVFAKNQENEFSEKEHIAGIFGGIKTKTSWSSGAVELSWFEAKGKIEQLFSQLNIVFIWETLPSTDKENILHPYKSALLSTLNNKNLGSFGQIHPILANQLNISTDIYLFEFDLEVIKYELLKKKLPVYAEYSLYPKIIKDLSFIVSQDVSFKRIQEVLYSNGTGFLGQINLLDEYRGQTIPDNQTSLCLQLVFQSNDKTLENKEIEGIINNLQSVLITKFNAIIRT